MTRNKPLVRPFLKWAGGKRQLLPEIRQFIPKKISTYYEPFVGAGAVLFDLQPKKAVINDFNNQLILTYLVIRDHLEELLKQLHLHAENNSEQYFYEIREQDRQPDFEKMSDIEKAARLIFLNKTCFNGLFRVNSQGLFNVPYGKYKRPAICEEPVLYAVNQFLNSHNITILNGDFANCLDSADKNSFVYFDPPYHSIDNTNFTGYQAGGFNEEQQTRLRDVFVELTNRGTKCLLSNSDTAFIRELYCDFKETTKVVEASRAINANAAGRGKVNELLIRNW